MGDYQDRKRPVHCQPLAKGNRPTILFVTFCTKNRKPLLARPEAFELILEELTSANHWLVGKFVVLPDHIHLFCSPGIVDPPPVNKWITFVKSSISKRWPWPNEHPIWESDCWDRQLRSGDSYGGKWEYVKNNPV